jgi:hypothetical protein
LWERPARRNACERGDMDLIVIAIIVGFFVVTAALAGLLDRL